MKGIKIDRKMLSLIGIGALVLCIIITAVSVVVSATSSKNDEVENHQYLSADFVHVSSDTELSSSETESNVTDSEANKSDTDTDSDFDSDDTGLLPEDCNSDFWQVKVGIAECYDHIFKQGHMIDDTAYYSGSCDYHDASQIQKLAQNVKLYRETNEDGSFSYSATLPEIGWQIMIYDENIKAIIDSQIAETEIKSESISIVMYYYDNTLQIEMAE